MSAGSEDLEDEGGGQSNGAQLDVIKSYAAFGWRAVRSRRLLAGSVFVVVSGVTVALLSVWPRMYHCDTVMMVQGNQMFQDSKQDALSGAAQVITRQNSLEAIVRDSELLKEAGRPRPFPFRLKDQLMTRLRGPTSEKDRERGLMGTLQYALRIDAQNGSLTISIDWPDAEMSARIVAAAQQQFLQSRHDAEVSTLAEYISILEGHASKVQAEIDGVAKQIENVRAERLSNAERSLAPSESKDPAPRVVRVAPKPAAAQPGVPKEQLQELAEQILAKQQELKEVADQRTKRVAELQAKLIELRTRFTDAHPEILMAESTMQSYSRPSPEETALRGQLAELKQRQQALLAADAAATGLPRPPQGISSVAEGPGPEPVSAEILKLMQDTTDDVDPAMASQLRLAVEKYAALRGKIGTARVDLDTAQAAFKHRYQIVVPAEPPNAPFKPKVPVVLGGGIAAAAVLALLICLLLELREDRLVERWQLHRIGIPILAELRLPPRSG